MHQLLIGLLVAPAVMAPAVVPALILSITRDGSPLKRSYWSA